MSEEALAKVLSSESPQCLRETVRHKLNDDVEAFLRQGGRVQVIADNVRADPPKKPTMNYGSAPI
jgi:hypothetical protein